MSYRPKVKTDSAGTTVDLAIDAESIQGKVPSNSAGNIPVIQQDGKLPSSILPSYVDDVVEYMNRSAFPVTGETGKIYVALDTNYIYRWSGTTYIRINYDDILTSNNTFTGTNNFIGELKIDGDYVATKDYVDNALLAKQDTLIDSGPNQNLKTINNISLLGTGNIEIQGGGASYQDIITNSDNRITSIRFYNATADDYQDIRSYYDGNNVYVDVNYLYVEDELTINTNLYVSYIYANDEQSENLNINAGSGSVKITSSNNSTYIYGYWDGRSINNCAAQICLTDNDYGGIVFYDRGYSYQSGGQTLYDWRTLAEFYWDDTAIYAEDISLSADSCLFLHSKDYYTEILFCDHGRWGNTSYANKEGGKVKFESLNLVGSSSVKNGSRISFMDSNGYNTVQRSYSSQRTYMTVDSRIGRDTSTGREIGGITWYGDMYFRSVSQSTLSQGGTPDLADGEMHLIAENYLIMKGSYVELTAEDDQLTISANSTIYLRPYCNDYGNDKIELYLSDDEYGCMGFYDASGGSGSTYSKNTLFYVNAYQLCYHPGTRGNYDAYFNIESDVDLYAPENLILIGYNANDDAKCSLMIGNYGEGDDTPGMVFRAWLGTPTSTELFKVTNNDITYKGVSLLSGPTKYKHKITIAYSNTSSSSIDHVHSAAISFVVELDNNTLITTTAALHNLPSGTYEANGYIYDIQSPGDFMDWGGIVTSIYISSNSLHATNCIILDPNGIGALSKVPDDNAFLQSSQLQDQYIEYIYDMIIN